MIYNPFGDIMKDNQSIKAIPYGVTDFEVIRKENAYYVDKTMYLRDLEKAGKYLFFIRPRRFGKSLFLSVMESYYDICRKDQFQFFFKGTDIFKNPTKEKNSYLILTFNFSGVNPDVKHVEHSFFEHVKEQTEAFISKYKAFLKGDEKEMIHELKAKGSPSDLLRYLTWLCREKSGQKLFIIIDEYDNFSNTILSTYGSAHYEDLTHGEGFFKTFFNVLKVGTTGTGAPISRLFITGVSPVTLDDVTSGCNIGKNISISPAFNTILGFTQKDVTDIIEYYRENELIKHSTPYLLEIMNHWYNNYIFSKDSTETLFNPDMVLYFIDRYQERFKIPDQLVDQNVKIDYGKLRHLITVDSDKGRLTNGNFSRLKQIIEEGRIDSDIAESFPLEKLTDQKNFLSLLFYFGLLTIKEVIDEEPVLQIPNQTIRRLYYDYIQEAYDETETFSIDFYQYGRLMRGMAYHGQWKPLFDYIAQRMKTSMSLRYLITGERSIQAFLQVYLGLSQRYIIHVERELNQGFADIITEPFTARYKEIKYSYLLEIKYMKKKKGKKTGADKNRELVQVIEQAREQAIKYCLDERFKKSIKNTRLIKLVLVFVGTELKTTAEVG
jgi:hypothetical protein